MSFSSSAREANDESFLKKPPRNQFQFKFSVAPPGERRRCRSGELAASSLRVLVSSRRLVPSQGADEHSPLVAHVGVVVAAPSLPPPKSQQSLRCDASLRAPERARATQSSVRISQLRRQPSKTLALSLSRSFPRRLSCCSLVRALTSVGWRRAAAATSGAKQAVARTNLLHSARNLFTSSERTYTHTHTHARASK